MTLRVYNTMSREKEPLVTREPGKVTAYVCGVTPYSRSHIGHARPSIVWDTIRRYLEYRGYRVFCVQNFTDIDDKIIAASAREGIPFRELAEKYSADYLASMDRLKVRRADIYPRATDHIGDIIEMIKALVERGHAYPSGGDVYFDVSSFQGYGKLSHRSVDDMMAGARVEPGEKKDDPMDFALWKGAKPGEPSWDSPWGPGRPGWHIECSAMSLRYLGDGFDLHGGGTDLIFPHHENEIAQSEAYTGKAPFVRYWLHNELVNLRGEKMSKSLGNIVTIQEVLDRFPPEVVRLAMLSAHYRSSLELSDESLEAAEKGWRKLEGARENARGFLRGSAADPVDSEMSATARRRFEEAMDDDFNTGLAIGVLFDLARDINNAVTAVSGTGPGAGGPVAGALDALETLAGIMGILREVGAADTDAGGGSRETVDALMGIILDIRETARKKRDWETSDAIRTRLAGLGFVIEDTPHGPRWKRERRD
ncbi:MAG: cysteine--tRNA ligase [Ignavibacteriales bacterium]